MGHLHLPMERFATATPRASAMYPTDTHPWVHHMTHTNRQPHSAARGDPAQGPPAAGWSYHQEGWSHHQESWSCHQRRLKAGKKRSTFMNSCTGCGSEKLKMLTEKLMFWGLVIWVGWNDLAGWWGRDRDVPTDRLTAGCWCEVGQGQGDGLLLMMDVGEMIMGWMVMVGCR
jgi:hypothetical protein